MKILSLSLPDDLNTMESQVYAMRFIESLDLESVTFLTQKISVFKPESGEYKTMIHIPVIYKSVINELFLKLGSVFSCTNILKPKNIHVMCSEPITVDETNIFWSFEIKDSKYQ